MTFYTGAVSLVQDRSPSDHSKNQRHIPRVKIGIIGGPTDRRPHEKAEFPAYLRPMDEPADFCVKR